MAWLLGSAWTGFLAFFQLMYDFDNSGFPGLLSIIMLLICGFCWQKAWSKLDTPTKRDKDSE